MLLDNKHILFHGAISGLPSSGTAEKWVDMQNMGPESQGDLGVFILFLTEVDTPTSLNVSILHSANADFSSPGSDAIMTTGTLLPATTAIPAGTLYQSRVPMKSAFPGGPTAADMARYVGLLCTHSGTLGTDEDMLVWLGSFANMPVRRGALT